MYAVFNSARNLLLGFLDEYVNDRRRFAVEGFPNSAQKPEVGACMHTPEISPTI